MHPLYIGKEKRIKPLERSKCKYRVSKKKAHNPDISSKLKKTV